MAKQCEYEGGCNERMEGPGITWEPAPAEWLDPLGGTRFEVETDADAIAVSIRRDPDLVGIVAGGLLTDETGDVRLPIMRGLGSSPEGYDTVDMEKIHEAVAMRTEFGSDLMSVLLQATSFGLGRLLTRGSSVGASLLFAGIDSVLDLSREVIRNRPTAFQRTDPTRGFGHELSMETPDAGHYAVFDVYVAPDTDGAPTVSVHSEYDVPDWFERIQDEVAWEIEFPAPEKPQYGDPDEVDLTPDELFFAEPTDSGAANVPVTKWRKGQPQVHFDLTPELPEPGEPVEMTAKGTRDPDQGGSIDRYHWHVEQVDGGFEKSYSGPDDERTYELPEGRHEVTVGATDSEGARRDGTWRVVSSHPTDVTLDVIPPDPAPGDPIEFDATDVEKPGDFDLHWLYTWQVTRTESYGDAPEGDVKEDIGPSGDTRAAGTETFDEPGVYEVTVEVTEIFDEPWFDHAVTHELGHVVTETEQFEVVHDLEAVISGLPGSVDVGETVTANADDSTAPSGATYTWYADGSQADTATNFEFTPESSGELSVRLVVETDYGASTETTETVDVDEDGGGGDELDAVISGVPDTAEPLDTVTASAENSTTPDGKSIEGYRWWFDGDLAGYGEEFEFVVEDVDSHEIKLQVRTSDENTDSETVVLQVGEDDGDDGDETELNADITGAPDFVNEGERIFVSGSESTAPSDDPIKSYVWYVDGEKEGEGSSFSFYAGHTNEHTVTLYVITYRQAADSDSVDITVKPSEVQ